MACFQSEGMAPSASDLFIKIARGLASALQPSLRSRAGILANPVDLDVLIFFSSLQTNSSLIVERLKVLLALADKLAALCREEYFLISSQLFESIWQSFVQSPLAYKLFQIHSPDIQCLQYF